MRAAFQKPEKKLRDPEKENAPCYSGGRTY